MSQSLRLCRIGKQTNAKSEMKMLEDEDFGGIDFDLTPASLYGTGPGVRAWA
jgi:hypothetical protein